MSVFSYRYPSGLSSYTPYTPYTPYTTVRSAPIGTPTATTTTLVEPTTTKASDYLALFVLLILAVIVFAILAHFFFPTYAPSEEPVVESPYEERGNFPDYQIVPPSTSPVLQWYLTPIEEQTIHSSYSPYSTRRFHSPENPTFY